MTRFEYLIPLVSIFVGLALADLLASLHRLLAARRRVRWHWVPLAWAAVAFLLTLRYWWAFFSLGQEAVWEGYFAFALHLLTALVPLYLLTAASLPDAVPDHGLDLLAFHFEHRRYFFGVLALYFAAVAVDTVARNGLPLALVPAVSLLGLGVALALVLAWSREEPVHRIATLAAVVLVLLYFVLFAVNLGA